MQESDCVACQLLVLRVAAEMVLVAESGCLTSLAALLNTAAAANEAKGEAKAGVWDFDTLAVKKKEAQAEQSSRRAEVQANKRRSNLTHPTKWQLGAVRSAEASQCG